MPWADDTPLPPRFIDTEPIYTTVQPDAVCITTLHTLHYEQAVQALDAEHHILMEKPMAPNAEHAHAIAEKVKLSGKVFVIA